MKNIRLSDELVGQATAYAEVESRSIPKQIEHWVKIGQVAEQNPDLTYGFIKEALLAKAEIDAGMGTKYVRRNRGNRE